MFDLCIIVRIASHRFEIDVFLISFYTKLKLYISMEEVKYKHRAYTYTNLRKSTCAPSL